LHGQPGQIKNQKDECNIIVIDQILYMEIVIIDLAYKR